MGKLKVITVSVPEGQEETAARHYARMGFEELTSYEVTRTNANGVLLETYHRNNYKFDFGQKNGDQLWNIYKTYKKKTAELETRKLEKAGSSIFYPKSMLILTAILTVVFLPFTPMLFGDDFCEFTRWEGFLFSGKEVFDFGMFIGCFFMSLCAALAIVTVGQVISSFVMRQKRMLLAIDRIPALEQEIEALTLSAEKLKD